MSIRKRNIKEKKNKSFTLIELVIVVAILVGILAPQYTKYVEKFRKAADASNMDELVKEIEVYAIDGNQLIATEYELTIGKGGKTATSGGLSINAIDSPPDSGLADALNEQFPDWRTKLTTKSKKWGNDGKAASIVEGLAGSHPLSGK